MKKKTLRQQLSYIRIVLLPRSKRTSRTYMELMIEESNQRLLQALKTLEG